MVLGKRRYLLHSLILVSTSYHSCIYFSVQIKYKLKLDSIQQHIDTHYPLTIRMKEGESYSIPFTEQSDEEYCYVHILSKQGEMLEQKLKNLLCSAMSTRMILVFMSCVQSTMDGMA